jgi:hypothetical protein
MLTLTRRCDVTGLHLSADDDDSRKGVVTW